MKKGFTLIELLIVVAIIAILAAIAIPNFLQAQVRAKVARVRADMRSIATAIESYVVDYNVEPPDGYYWAGENYENNSLRNFVNEDSRFFASGYWCVQPLLTTPIAYLTNVSSMLDPFRPPRFDDVTLSYIVYRYKSLEWTWGSVSVEVFPQRNNISRYAPILEQNYMGRWALLSYGPDGRYTTDPYRTDLGYPSWPTPYDPTNGVVSEGVIQRTQLHPDGLF